MFHPPDSKIVGGMAFGVYVWLGIAPNLQIRRFSLLTSDAHAICRHASLNATSLAWGRGTETQVSPTADRSLRQSPGGTSTRGICAAFFWLHIEKAGTWASSTGQTSHQRCPLTRSGPFLPLDTSCRGANLQVLRIRRQQGRKERGVPDGHEVPVFHAVKSWKATREQS